MKILDRLKSALKSFNWAASDLPGNVSSSGAAARSFFIPGTRINWDLMTGELLTCPAVQACFNTLFRNLPQSPPYVREKNAAGDWEAVVGHPLTYLLNRPNPRYDGGTLRNMIAYSLYTNGNAYVVIERTKGKEPAELWYVPHDRIELPPNTGEIITTYIMTDMRGVKHYVPAEDMWHIKFALNPRDPRFGLAPLMSSKRPTYSLQLSSNYRANIMRNFGVAGKIISAKEGATDQLEFDPKELKDRIDDQSKGDNVGSTVVTEMPIDVHYPAVTPKDMASDTFEDRDEALICALFGVPPQVALLLVGRLMKTDANWKEAREQFWEDCIMPLNSLNGTQATQRLLPEFEPNKAVLDRMEVAFDYSEVRALQPDLDNLHNRARDDWLANLISKAEWKMATGGKPEPGDENIYYRDMSAPPAISGDGQPLTPLPGKMVDLKMKYPNVFARIEAEIERLDVENEPAPVLNGTH